MPRKIYKCECGGQTYEKDSFCIFCKAKARAEAQYAEPITPEEEASVAKFKDKECECGVMFTPGGPRQKHCKECQKKPKGGKKTPPRNIKPPKKTEAGGLPAVKERPMPKVTPPGNDDKYDLPLDFSQYPLLHQKLIKEAEKDFRPPELEALYLLNNTFESMERKLAEAAAKA